MARIVNVGDIVQVAFAGRHAGQRTLNIWHYKLTAVAVGGQDWTGYATNLVTQYNNAGGLTEKYLDCCSDEFQLEEIRVQAIRANRYSYESFPQGPDPGNVAEEALPPNDGVTITKRNEFTTRHDRGSIHMPGVPRTFVSNGSLLAAGTAAYTAFAEELKKVMLVTVLTATIDMTPVIYNRSNPLVSQPWSEYIIQATSRVNRRRTVGLGE